MSTSINWLVSSVAKRKPEARASAGLVCTGRRRAAASFASARGVVETLLCRPSASVGLGRPTVQGGLRNVPAQALGTKGAACGLSPEETCWVCRLLSSSSLSKNHLFRQEQVLPKLLVWWLAAPHTKEGASARRVRPEQARRWFQKTPQHRATAFIRLF